eukprot:Gb_24981 [translate_table: standard]
MAFFPSRLRTDLVAGVDGALRFHQLQLHSHPDLCANAHNHPAFSYQLLTFSPAPNGSPVLHLFSWLACHILVVQRMVPTMSPLASTTPLLQPILPLGDPPLTGLQIVLNSQVVQEENNVLSPTTMFTTCDYKTTPGKHNFYLYYDGSSSCVTYSFSMGLNVQTFDLQLFKSTTNN